MNILINAYAVCPNKGSEPGMGWNWISNIAKYCNLFIITEGEWRVEIDEALKNHPYKQNMHFFYLPVTEKIRKMCWNQGDWRFYYYYRQWQKMALKQAQQICRENDIDVIHQLNMIGFREPGLLWKIEGPKYVWGPIGGLIDIPVNYLWRASKKQAVKTIFKKTISAIQIRFSPNTRKAIQRADILIGSTNQESNTIQQLYRKKVVQINETCTQAATETKEHQFSDNGTFNIVWVGRFILTKQLELALKTMVLLKKNPQIKLHIVGTGQEEMRYKSMAAELGIQDSCIWHGQVDNRVVQRMMNTNDLFFFTSIAEATSTVVLEAISNNLPVLCFDAFGFGSIVDKKIGIKIPLTNPQQSVKDFAEKIEYLYNHREVLRQMSENCKERAEELSWENKAKQMVKLYEKCS